MTPFVGQLRSAESRDAVVSTLVGLPRSRECTGWLVLPQKPQVEGDDKIRVKAPLAFGRSWAQAFASPREACVLPLPLCVESIETRNRNLHTKAILVENDDDALLMIGSSNFTPHGMGVGVHNLEANLIFEDRVFEPRGGMTLEKRLQLPIDWHEALEVTQIAWEDPHEPPEDDPSTRLVPPAFFSWASYSQVTGGVDP